MLWCYNSCAAKLYSISDWYQLWWKLFSNPGIIFWLLFFFIPHWLQLHVLQRYCELILEHLLCGSFRWQFLFLLNKLNETSLVSIQETAELCPKIRPNTPLALHTLRLHPVHSSLLTFSIVTDVLKQAIWSKWDHMGQVRDTLFMVWEESAWENYCHQRFWRSFWGFLSHPFFKTFCKITEMLLYIL